VKVRLHAFVTSAIHGDEWWATRQAAISPGKCHRYSINRTLTGLQHRSRHFGEERNFILFGFERLLPDCLESSWI